MSLSVDQQIELIEAVASQGTYLSEDDANEVCKSLRWLLDLIPQAASGVRCCKGCPDCMGIDVREQMKGLTADLETLLTSAGALLTVYHVNEHGGNPMDNKFACPVQGCAGFARQFDDIRRRLG